MNAERAASRVIAPARLHLGFLDPDASLGRRFGSIGVTLDGIATAVSAVPGATLTVDGGGRRAREMAETLLQHFALPRAVDVRCEALIPAHAGLGSGTQLALALGTALCRSFGIETTAAELGAVLGRGQRSGIGLAAFAHGGLVVDGGRGAGGAPPPLVSRAAMPSDWRVVLVLDRVGQGLSGRAEREAFERLAPLAQDRAAHLCHLTLMQLLPALGEADFDAFSAAVGEIQAVIGDYFAAVQAGRYTSAAVRDALEFSAMHFGLRGVGQSSWGPTGFVFVADAAAAARLVDALAARNPALDYRACAFSNAGAFVTTEAWHAPRRRADA